MDAANYKTECREIAKIAGIAKIERQSKSRQATQDTADCRKTTDCRERKSRNSFFDKIEARDVCRQEGALRIKVTKPEIA